METTSPYNQPPFKPNRCTYSLPRGDFLIKWPCVITAEEYEDLVAFLDLVKKRIKRDIRDPEDGDEDDGEETQNPGP